MTLWELNSKFPNDDLGKFIMMRKLTGAYEKEIEAHGKLQPVSQYENDNEIGKQIREYEVMMKKEEEDITNAMAVIAQKEKDLEDNQPGFELSLKLGELKAAVRALDPSRLKKSLEELSDAKDVLRAEVLKLERQLKDAEDESDARVDGYGSIQPFHPKNPDAIKP